MLGCAKASFQLAATHILSKLKGEKKKFFQTSFEGFGIADGHPEHENKGAPLRWIYFSL